MSDSPAERQAHHGLLASLKGLLGTGVSAVETRLGLAAADLERERIRATVLLLWATAFLFAVFLGIVLLAILLVVIFWDSHRVLLLALLSGFFLVAAVAIGLGLRAWLRSAPRPFRATLAELAKDRERLAE
jgi:uncharacterized membrane protein YqjE